MRFKIALLLVLAAAGPGFADGLADPFLAEVGGQPIDLADGVGHAAPLWFDWDGDGLNDLIVGQFKGGHLRIHRNIGKRDAPVFGECTWFEAGGERAKVESG